MPEMTIEITQSDIDVAIAAFHRVGNPPVTYALKRTFKTTRLGYMLYQVMYRVGGIKPLYEDFYYNVKLNRYDLIQPITLTFSESEQEEIRKALLKP